MEGSTVLLHQDPGRSRAEAGGGEVSAAPQGPPQIVHLIGWSPKTVSMSMLSSAPARSPAAAVSSHEIYGFEKLPVTIGFSSAIVKIETYLSYRHKIAASHCSNFPVWTLVFSWWKPYYLRQPKTQCLLLTCPETTQIILISQQQQIIMNMFLPT